MRWLINFINKLTEPDIARPQTGEAYTLQQIRKMADLGVMRFHGHAADRYSHVMCTQQELRFVAEAFGSDAKWLFRNEAWTDDYEFHLVSSDK